MGLTTAIGLGVALGHSGRVGVIDGDGTNAKQAEQTEGSQVVGREARPVPFGDVPDAVYRVLHRVDDPSMVHH